MLPLPLLCSGRGLFTTMTHYNAPLSVDGGALFLAITELLYYINWVCTNQLPLSRVGPFPLRKHDIMMFHSRQQCGRKFARRVNTAGRVV
jgi:hypothetical protein